MQVMTDVYCLKGSFLVFNSEHALALRKKRILGQLVGCSPKNPYQLIKSGLPLHLSHYAARIIYEERLAVFKRIVPNETISKEQNESQFAKRLVETQEDAKKKFLEKRVGELKKRRIVPSADKIGEFDEKMIKINILNEPESKYSSLCAEVIDEDEIAASFNVRGDKIIVFRDLYRRGFYVGMGMKFGCDFLVYQGDPVRYHAKFAIRLVANKGGQIDLAQIQYNELNTLHRLCHTANKSLVFATIISEDDTRQRVEYWTLRARQYIQPDSSPDIFEKSEL